MIVAGVDTHKSTHALCILDARGETILEGEFEASSRGYEGMARAIGDPAGCEGVGIEGTSTYGAGLARHLMERGYRVYEVPSPKRPPRRPGSDKSDPLDARRAAMAVLVGEGLTDPKPGIPWIEEVRALQTAREQAVRTQTAMVNAARGILVHAPEPLRERLDRGGDRQANRALFSMALVRMRHDERTKAYVERRTSEGLSKKEIIRCLKRYIAREAYRCLKECS